MEVSGTKPTLINGIVVVPKDETLQRMIIDDRNANEVFYPLSDPGLSNTGLLVDLHLPKRKVPFVSKLDLEN